MGRRINLAQLAGVAVLDAAVPPSPGSTTRLTQAPLAAVAANPVNPRELIDDVSDLESMRSVGQLQPCAVVTTGAFLAIYPEHAERVGDADYVVVAGSRRRLAAETFGLATLDIVIRDVLAADRATFYGASVSENIDRRNLDPLEEARAVEHLARECGSGTKAGGLLGKSKGWVSQRLALLRLSPQMQALLRAGDLPIRDARRLAALPEAEQLTAWERERAFTAVNDAPAVQPPAAEEHDEVTGGVGPGAVEPNRRPPSTRLPEGATMEEIAAILRSRLTQAELHQLVEVLIRTT